MNFSNKYRTTFTKQASSEKFDVLIIGGGITGAGILLDAQSRGLKACLVEMQDFAEGTSSRSTKLIHGGLRYLKQKEFKLVAEVGKERTIVADNAPHLTKPEKVLVPLIKGGSIGKLTGRIGMKIYDWIAGVRREDRHKILGPLATLQKEPKLKKEGLKGAIYYTEYKTDDARLTMEIIKKGYELGGVALNYTKAESFYYNKGRVVGAVVKDLLTEEEYTIDATYVVNATGPWTDEVCYLDGKEANKKLFLTKGVHLVFDDERFPLQQAVYFDVKDGRMVFAIPTKGKTYLGTTDTVYQDDLANPGVTKEDVKYLLNATNEAFPELNLKVRDIESSWSGLRPLIHQKGKSASEISRKDEVFVSESQLITIAGGKLTGYRKMAEKVVDIIAGWHRQIEILPKCSTDKIILSGGEVNGNSGFVPYMYSYVNRSKLQDFAAKFLVKKYGSNAAEAERLYLEKGEKIKLPPSLSAALLYSLEHEMISSLTDFFVRRIGMVYFQSETVEEYIGEVAKVMTNYLGWSADKKKKEVQTLKEELAEATLKDLR